MERHNLICSTIVREIYEIYSTLNDEFLKAFKHQAEFRITTTTSGKDFCLGVEDVTETERKWLENAVLELSQKKLKNSVDEK